MKFNIEGAAQTLHNQIKQKWQINRGGQRVGRRLCRQRQLTREVTMNTKGEKQNTKQRGKALSKLDAQVQ